MERTFHPTTQVSHVLAATIGWLTFGVGFIGLWFVLARFSAAAIVTMSTKLTDLTIGSAIGAPTQDAGAVFATALANFGASSDAVVTGWIVAIVPMAAILLVALYVRTRWRAHREVVAYERTHANLKWDPRKVPSPHNGW